MGEQVTLDDWRSAYEYFCQKTTSGITLSYDDTTWNRVVKLLHDCFIRTQRKSKWTIVTTYNPSVSDFLITYIGQNPITQGHLIQNALFPDQLTYAFKETETNSHSLPNYLRHNYSSLHPSNASHVTVKFKAFLDKEPLSCKIRYTPSGLVKPSFDTAIFVKQFIDCFPNLFKSISPQIKDCLICLITNGNYGNFSERMSILTSIDLETDQSTLTNILTKLSKEDIPLDEYASFIDLLKTSNNDSIITECFVGNLEEAMIVDMDSFVINDAEYEQQKELYKEIESVLPDGISLYRAFEHLEEVEASLPTEPDDYDEDYYRERYDTYKAEDAQIDQMMQSLRN
jgi:hypothetical protein